jgi:ubiquitin-conjugating enzyme E2 W
MASRIASKRLGKELAEIQTNGPPTGSRLLRADDLEVWEFALQVLGEDTVYQGGASSFLLTSLAER